MQQKQATSYFLNVIGTLALGEDRKPKNEVSLRPALVFFQRNFARVNSRRPVRKAHKQSYSNKIFQFHWLTL